MTWPAASSASRRRPGASGSPSPLSVITPAMLGQVVISGLLAGALYAMVALGLGLIFGVMRGLNVSHGPLLMLGADTTFWLFQWLGAHPYLSPLLSLPP